MTGTDVDDTIGPSAIGTLLAGRFRITSLLGRGGMASVYLAEDESLGRAVAVKIFRSDLANGDDLQRQQEEIQLLAGLNHPSLVTLFDAATDESGNAFLVMELVDGTDLHTRLRSGPLDRSEVAVVGQHLADALAYVHSRGVIHRDIKPGNILLPEHDAEHTGPQAKLADFGIARIVDGSRLTATGQVLGTASYLSPEQALGEGITPASDVYSLGLVLLECLTGQQAYPGSAVESMTARLARDPEVPTDLGDRWVGLLRGMTSRTPEARPTARDVSGALSRLAESPPPTRRYPSVAEATERAEAATTAKTTPVVPAPGASKKRTRTQAFGLPPATGDSTKGGMSWRKILLAIGVLAVVLIVAWIATTALNPGDDPSAAPDYPAVEGPLGTHLEQLQRSVEP